MPPLAPWQWALGALCAFFAGVAKTGVPGLGIMVVPLMVLAVGDARLSAGWLLPLLCAADVFAIAYYRRHTQTRKLWALIPWVAVGMTGGAFMLGLPEKALRHVVGVIVAIMLLAHVRRRWGAADPVQQDLPSWLRALHSALFGLVGGFATMIANAAGPVMNVYLLTRRLPKEEFIATGAWLFFVINLSKLPVYTARGMMSAHSLAFDAVLLPVLFAGALSGRALFRRIPQRLFEAVVLALTAVSTALLFL